MKNIIYFIQTIWWKISEFFVNIWRISPEKAERNIINKMLKPYGVDINYVIKNPEIEGISWYQYYTFNSLKEHNRWKKYAFRQYKRAYPYSSSQYIEKKVKWMDFQYGLKTNYEN